MASDDLPEMAAPRPRRPLAGLAMAFVGGVALAYGRPCDWPVPAALAVALSLVLLAALVRRRGAATVLLMAAALMAGATRARLNPDDTWGVTADLARPQAQAEVVARITSDPDQGETSGGRTVWQFHARAESLRHAGGWREARGDMRVALILDDRAPIPRYGDRWRLSGVLTRDSARGDPARRMDVRSGGGQRLSSGGGRALVRWCYARRHACRALLQRGLDGHPDEAAIIQSLLLGYRGDLPGIWKDEFLRTGTLHILAISGTHVGVMLLLLLPVMRWTGLARPYWGWVILPVLLAYTVGTGASASAIRAWVMASAFWIALAVSRRPDFPQALALAALLIVAVAPEYVRDPGFVYSFTAVAGLMAFQPVFMAAGRRWGWTPGPDPDSGLPANAGPRRAMARVRIYLFGLATASLAAWIVSTPLSARYGNVVSPVALAANLPLIPLSSVVLATGVLSILTGSIAPVPGEIFNHANAVFAGWLMELVRVLARVPGGSMYVQTPPWAAVGAVYVALAGLWILRGRPRRALAGGLLAIAAAGAVRYATEDRVRVEFAGPGLSPTVFINVPGGGDVLADPGPVYRSDRLVRFLRSRGVDRLKALVLTQADAGHAGGADELAARIPTDEVWYVPDSGRSPVYRATIEQLKKQGCVLRLLNRGQGGTLAGGAEWRALFPAPGVSYPRAADGALVWRVGRGPAALLFTGPCGRAAAEQVRDLPPDPGATLWAMDRSANTEDLALLDAIGARTVILRAPPGIPDAVPSDAFSAAAARRGASVFRVNPDTGGIVNFPPDPGRRKP